MARPVVGITGPDRGGFPAWLFASACVRIAGGRPVRITPSRGAPRERLDGLVIGGGADVDPKRYGVDAEDERPPIEEELVAERGIRRKLRVLVGLVVSPVVFALRRIFTAPDARIDRARDALELALLERVAKDGAPVLGICRGAQLMNVYLGGTLHRDLSPFYVEGSSPWTVFPRKRVCLERESRLAVLLACRECWVNSLHRQAVDDLGEGLAIAAREPNGVVQAIEKPDHRFFVGVQWHPEYLPQKPEQRRLFRELVRAAEAHRVSVLGGGRVGFRVGDDLVADLPVPEEDRQVVREA